MLGSESYDVSESCEECKHTPVEPPKPIAVVR
jgi:hypothetical protein